MDQDVEVPDNDDTFYSLAPDDGDGGEDVAVASGNLSVYQDTLDATLNTTIDCDAPSGEGQLEPSVTLDLGGEDLGVGIIHLGGVEEGVDLGVGVVDSDIVHTYIPPVATLYDPEVTPGAMEDVSPVEALQEVTSSQIDILLDEEVQKDEDVDEDEFAEADLGGMDTILLPTVGTITATTPIGEEVVGVTPDEILDPDHITIAATLPEDEMPRHATERTPPPPPAIPQPLSPSMQSICLTDSSDIVNSNSQFSEIGQNEMSRFSDASDATRPNSIAFPPSDVVELPLPTAEPRKPQVTTPTSYFGSTASPTAFVQQIVPEPDLDDSSDCSLDSELWLPTQDTLSQIAQKAEETLDPQFLTKARPNSTVAFVSPAVELVMKYHGEMAAQRLQTTLPPVSESNLRHLVKEGRLLSAVNMLTELLNSAEMSVKTIRLWTLRFALLVKLKLYSTAEVEMAMFGNLDNCDLYYEFHAAEHHTKRGSIIPWSFRLLWSILPLHCPSIGGLYGALDRMYGLVYHLDQALLAGLPYVQEQRVIKYKTSLLVQVAGALAGSGSIQPAIKLLKQIKTFQPELSLPVSNAMIRLYYQVGNIFKGETLLGEIQDRLSEEEREMNAGFKLIAHGEYSEAYQHFARAVNVNPTNTVASINGAVCLLYLGRLGDSIIQFEGAIKTSLHPMLLFNLVSLYELKTIASTSKKYNLLDTITSKTDWEGFPFECLRL